MTTRSRRTRQGFLKFSMANDAVRIRARSGRQDGAQQRPARLLKHLFHIDGHRIAPEERTAVIACGTFRAESQAKRDRPLPRRGGQTFRAEREGPSRPRPD